MSNKTRIANLLREAQKNIGYCSVCNAGQDECDKPDCEECRAEYLLSHGLLKWFSAEEPPEVSGVYIVYSPFNNTVFTMQYSAKHKMWNAIDELTQPEAAAYSIEGITHWMDLPKPPINATVRAPQGATQPRR